MMPQFGVCLLRSSGVLIFLALWESAPRLGWIDPYFVPPLSTVLTEIGLLVSDGSLPIHLLVSCWRAMTGLVIALAIALPLGVVLGRWLTGVADAFSPVFRVLSQVNPFTLLPVFILFFGIGETAKVAVVAWVTLWPILFYTITATRTVDPIQIKTAAAMGLNHVEMTLKVIVPAALPTVFIGIRIGCGLTFLILVAAEMLGASSGLGWLVHNSAMNYLIPRIYAGAAFIIVCGFVLNRFLLYLERSLFAWHEPAAPGAGTDDHLFPSWQPEKRTALFALVVLLVFLALGGNVVQRLNREAASGAAGMEDHSRHFGTSVDSGGKGF